MGVTAGTKLPPKSMHNAERWPNKQRSGMLPTFAEAHQMVDQFLVVIDGTAGLQQGCNLGAGLQIR